MPIFAKQYKKAYFYDVFPISAFNLKVCLPSNISYIAKLTAEVFLRGAGLQKVNILFIWTFFFLWKYCIKPQKGIFDKKKVSVTKTKYCNRKNIPDKNICQRTSIIHRINNICQNKVCVLVSIRETNFSPRIKFLSQKFVSFTDKRVRQRIKASSTKKKLIRI